MLVSQAEYARQRGVSRQYIGQMVSKGVIELKNKKVDPTQADKALASVREPARPERRSQTKTDPAPTLVSLPSETPQLPQGGDLSTLLLKTRIKSEVEKAKLLEIKARAEAGKYVDADEVKVAAFNRARVVRDSLLNIPERLAAVLAAEEDASRVHALLHAEIRSALEDLSGAS